MCDEYIEMPDIEPEDEVPFAEFQDNLINQVASAFGIPSSSLLKDCETPTEPKL